MTIRRYLRAGTCLAFALALIPASARANNALSATPGTICGVVTITAPGLDPNEVEVDAEDVTNTYTATTRVSPYVSGSTQSGTSTCPGETQTCAPGSNNWCYSILAESALATSYVLRAVAYVNSNVTPAPAVYEFVSIPFPPTTPGAVVFAAPGDTVLTDISFTPAELSGVISPSDLSSNPLPIFSTYMSVNTPTPQFTGCGGSANPCYAFPLWESASGPYELFLQPGVGYIYGTVGFSTVEQSGAGYDAYQWEDNISPSVPSVPAVVNEPFSEIAEVDGTAGFPVPIYNITMTVQGETSTVVNGVTGQFASQYLSTSGSGLPLTDDNYVIRIYSGVDMTKPLSLSGLFVLSANNENQLEFPPVPITFPAGSNTLVDNFSGVYGTITSRVTLDPPYQIISGYELPGIQAEETDVAGYGSSTTTFVGDANGGSFVIPAFGPPTYTGNWNYWRFGYSLGGLASPNFESDYFIDDFLNIPVEITAASGPNITAPPFVLQTSLVKVFFTAPKSIAGSTLSDPQLVGTTLDSAENFYAEGHNTTDVVTGEADLVLRPHVATSPASAGPNGQEGFSITPSAAINPGGAPATSRTQFSPFILFPNGGDVTVVGVPGPIALTVNTPANGATLPVCQIPVSGVATGVPNITITVDGQTVADPSTSNPNDPLQVGFTTTLYPPAGPVTITVTATDAQGDTVTDTLQVSCSAPVAPALTCPGASSLVCPTATGAADTLSVGVSDTPGDALQVSWAVDGSTVSTNGVAAGASSATYSGNFAAGAVHTVVVTATDSANGGTSSCSTTVTVPAPVVCPAPGPCATAGSCDPTTGACTNSVAADGTACNDGNACTDNDVCTGGVCAGTPYTCTAPDQCQEAASCNGDGGCTFTNVPDGTSCSGASDGTGCFGHNSDQDVCVGGQCTHPKPCFCPPPNDCQSSVTCNYDGTCSYTNKPDYIACTGDDGWGSCGGQQGQSLCESGECTKVCDCAAPNQCQESVTCNPNGSCTYTNKANGTSCGGSSGYSCGRSDGDVCNNGTCEPPPPTVTCPPPTTTHCGKSSGTGSLAVGISNPGGTPLNVKWTVDGSDVRSDTLSGGVLSDSYAGTFSRGTHNFECTISDDNGHQSSCTTTLTLSSGGSL